jgi:hemoglobin
LYNRLGANAGISAVIDDFIGKVAADTRINSFFAAAAADQARLMKLRNNLINQVGQASGGCRKIHRFRYENCSQRNENH